MLLDRYAEFRVNVENLAKNLAKYENARMAPMGLRGIHALCLFYLGHAPNGMTAASLAEACGVDKGLISRVIADLLSKDQIRRSTPENVRYRARYVLTADGQACLRQVTRFITHTMRELKDEITDEELATFFKVMLLMNRHLSESGD